MKKTALLGFVAFLGLYLFSTGISYAVFTYVVAPPSLEFISPQGNQEEEAINQEEKEDNTADYKQLIDTSGPKTAICPMNGQLFTEKEKEAWEQRRPLLIMIENHEEARPQSGLSSADIVYETVAEGGITRFMGVFYCDAQSHEAIVGPVRSARSYFINWASEYGANPLYAHVGGANCNHGCPGGTSEADALGQIEDYGWGGSMGNDLNQFAIGYPTYWRDYERMGHTVATEHTMYSTTERLWALAKKREWTNVDSEGNAWDEDFVPWQFYEEGKEPKIGDVTTIGYDFWENSPAGDYSVSWKFDPEKKVYLRSNAGKEHLDLDTNKQLSAKNIIVMYSVESNADDGYPSNAHLLYDTIGTGTGVLFQNGNATEITWTKDSRTDRTIFEDADTGKEISFIPGKIWISNLAKGNKTLEY
ncbi:DUF3048 domain-containing protein [Candidatus Beckwithbacteria bacterium]|nr:DUF3048 domain-containing protein [Candidatus Beckwithbacteria bacterium]